MSRTPIVQTHPAESRGECAACDSHITDLRDNRCRECDVAAFEAAGGDVDDCLDCGTRERVRGFLDLTDGLCFDCDDERQRAEREAHDRSEFYRVI